MEFWSTSTLDTGDFKIEIEKEPKDSIDKEEFLDLECTKPCEINGFRFSDEQIYHVKLVNGQCFLDKEPNPNVVKIKDYMRKYFRVVN